MEDKMIARPQVAASEANFISKVFLWMALGLGLSAAGAFWLLAQPGLMKAIFSNTILLFGILIAEIGLVVWLSAGVARMSTALATAVFCGYSFLNGVTLCSILLVYTGASVLSTFAITAGTFLFFSIYGMTTKKDLTSMGSLAMMGLFGVILASVVNMFLKSAGLSWGITFVGIAVFLGLIAYDTQKLKAMHAMGFENADMEKKGAILGALALYLDFINLFIMLLQLFGRRRN